MHAVVSVLFDHVDMIIYIFLPWPETSEARQGTLAMELSILFSVSNTVPLGPTYKVNFKKFWAVFTKLTSPMLEATIFYCWASKICLIIKLYSGLVNFVRGQVIQKCFREDCLSGNKPTKLGQ